MSPDRLSCEVRRTIAGQQVHRPSGTPDGGLGARDGDQEGFIARVELTRCAGTREFAEREHQPLLDETLLRAVHGRRPDTHGACDQFVGRVGIGGEENVRLRPLDLANGPLATV